MSLLGRTLAARNVKLIDPNGVTYTIGSMHLNQVNWLTLIGANPFGNGIAGQADLEELAIAHDAYGITTPKGGTWRSCDGPGFAQFRHHHRSC